MNSRITLLHLSLISGIGPATIAKLIHAFSFERIAILYQLTSAEIIQAAQLPATIAQIITVGLRDSKLLELELSLIDKHAITWLTLYDTGYPELLKHIHLPPTILYVRGPGLEHSLKSLAVVGSRACDAYGTQIITMLIPQLVAQNYTIVSGGALGIDTLAHDIALKNGGITVAVLGSGLLRPYPNINNKLFERIVNQGGAVISSFALMAEPLPGNFPARNRIIAGLASGCLVVQAAQKSGSLITASFALENGREVFAVPGPINNPLSAGCHSLIAQGATLVASVIDIQKAFGEEIVSYTENVVAQKIASPAKQLPVAAQLKQEQLKMPEAASEKILYYAQVAISFDELLMKSELSVQELQDMLFEMQIDGRIEQDVMGFWQKI